MRNIYHSADFVDLDEDISQIIDPNNDWGLQVGTEQG